MARGYPPGAPNPPAGPPRPEDLVPLASDLFSLRQPEQARSREAAQVAAQVAH